VQMLEGEIGFKGEYGISLTKSTAALMGVTIKGNGTGQEGIKLSEGMIDLFRTNIREVHKGMSVENGVVRMFGGEIGFTKDYGVYLKKGGVALKDVRMTYTGSSPTADFIKVEGGTVVAEDIIITSTTGKGQGISVTQRGHVVLIKPTYINVDKGMTISEGTVRMFGGSMEFKGDYGVYLTRGNALLKGVRMTYTGSNKTADFIKVEGGTIIAEGVNITSTTGKGQGVKVNKEGAVWLKNATFTKVKNGMTVTDGIVRMEGGSLEFKGEYAIYLTKGDALLDDVSITGPSDKGTGVIMQNGVGVVMMKEVDISKVTTGVSVISGNLMMHKGSVAFNGEYGVSLIRGNAALNDVRITGPSNKGTGVYAMGMGEVMMKEVRISEVQKGVEVTSGKLIMHKGSVEFKGGYGVSLIGGDALLNGVRITGQDD
ncbi:hypothetical protein, partial [Bartonella bovis]|uniref:hypothetical protein n=1 Tax=Bartonella bovis TaxID=155194 RepID=UPI001304FE54